MVTPVIVFLALVVVIYFVIKSSYDQKLREETFEFTKKMHKKDQELQEYKAVSQITPNELYNLKRELAQSQAEVQKWIKKHNNLELELYSEKANSKKIKEAISQINDNVKQKKRNDPGSNSGGSNDDSSNFAIMMLAAGLMQEDNSSSYQGSGGDTSGGGSSDSYESSSRASSYESSDSSSSYDSGSYDSSSSCDSSSSSDSGSCGGD